MRMIEPGRTNVVPLTMLALCVGLFILRAGVIYYGTFFQPVKESMIVWQKPKPIDKARKDLLSTPTLYFFCDNSDQLNQISSQVIEQMLFHNREVASLIKQKVIPVKVVLNGENSDALSKSLKGSLRVYRCPAICLALPNGMRIDDTSWQSDRMFVAFLQDALKRTPRTAANEAMRNRDWALACRAYELDDKTKKSDAGVDLYDAIYWSFALRHLKDEKTARNVLEDALKRVKKSFSFYKQDYWPEPCVQYLLGDISYEELMKKAGKNNSKYSYRDETAHYVCGTKYLLDGNIELAKKELKIIADDRGARDLYSAKYARSELRELGENYPEKDDDLSSLYY